MIMEQQEKDFRTQETIKGPLIKPGTWNILEHQIFIIIMRKTCKIKF